MSISKFAIVIAEKNSQAAAYAAAFSGTKRMKEGDYNYFVLPSNKVFQKGGYILPAVGHLLEISDPATVEGFEYLKNWSIEHVPLPVPYPYTYVPIERTKNVLFSMKRLIRAAIEQYGISNITVVSGTDIDAEGSVIANTAIKYCLSNEEFKLVEYKRLWTNSLEEKAVYHAFNHLKDRELELRMVQSGMTRAAGDWQTGLSLTRLLTILSKSLLSEIIEKMNSKQPFVNERVMNMKVPFTISNTPSDQERIQALFDPNHVYTGVPITLSIDDVFSTGAARMGRVVTCVKHFIYKRENEIANFVPRVFYEIKADFKSDKGNYTGKVEGFKTFDKEELNDKLKEFNLLANGTYDAFVQEVKKERKQSKAPQLHSLTTLQALANRRWKMSAKLVQNTMQQLYLKKMVSYPRTSNIYITPLEFNYLRNNLEAYKQAFNISIDTPNLEPRKRYVNSDNVLEHHGIILTDKIPTPEMLGDLTANERTLYMEIVRRTIAMFAADYEYEQTDLYTNVNDLIFKSTGKVECSKGFKELWEDQTSLDTTNSDDEEKEQKIPALETNQKVKANVLVKDGTTKPPLRYTEASLIEAMKSAGKQLDNEADAALLNSVEGIGTPATRADAIESLKEAQYVVTAKNYLIPTTKLMIICKLTELTIMANPIQSAKWQKYLDMIKEGIPGKSYMEFMNKNTEAIKGFKSKVLFFAVHPEVQKYIAMQLAIMQQANEKTVCPICKKGQVTKRTNTEKKSYYACSQYFSADPSTKCKLIFSAAFAGHTFTKAQIQKLLTKGQTGLIKNLKSRKDPNKTYEANIKLNFDTMKFEMEFGSNKSPTKTKKS